MRWEVMMRSNKGYLIYAVILFSLLGGCTPSYDLTKDSFVYQGINFGSNRNKNFKLGVKDACSTADGIYTKDHKKFNSNESYRIGWKLGRLKCKGKQ